MRLHHTFIILFLIGALCTGAAGQVPSLEAKPEPESAPAKVVDPMAGFARMIPGEWHLTFQGGTSIYDTWHWGPGKHSMRVMTDGFGADGEPWRKLDVMYWHPGRRQVRLLHMHRDVPGIGRGVGEGAIKFDGDTAYAVFDLYQPGVRRKLNSRWTFDGPDKYHEILSESSGPAGFQPLVEWDRVRINKRTEPQPPTAEHARVPSKQLQVFEALVGHIWEAQGTAADGDDFHIQSTFEWVPYVEVVYARTAGLSRDGAPTHLFDVYFYHHTGTDALRCLALSSRGGVYEGDFAILESGALQFDLKSYEGDGVVQHLVRIDFEQDGTVHHRVWSLKDTERTLLLDFRHKKLGPSKD